MARKSKYEVGQRVRVGNKIGRIFEVDSETNAIDAIQWDDNGEITYFVYLNKKQESFLQAKQPYRTWIGGRGTGKSRNIGNSTYQKLIGLERSRGGFISATYAQILTKTLPPIMGAWAALGLKEYKSPEDPGHYVIGRRPPKGWPSPYSDPKRYENIISFYQGSVIEMMSMDRPDLQRGGSLDYIEVDEALIVPKEHLHKVVLPSVRGTHIKFKGKWCWKQKSLYSSMPYLTKGAYLLDMENKARLNPKQYFYIESTAYDNIHVLGQDFIDDLRMELDPIIFGVEIMNKRSGKTSYAFYHKFNDEYHGYIPNYIYGYNEHGAITVLGNSDREKTAPLYSSWDFSGWFKCATIYQERKGVEYMINAFHRKENDSIDGVVDDICISFADQKFKQIHIFGEPLGHNKEALGGTIYMRIWWRFKQNGWNAIISPNTHKKSDFHEVRYEFINEVLEETNPRLPKFRINTETCKSVVISLNRAEVDAKGKKNKKDEDNKSFNQEYATHFTDTVDYYFMQKYGKSGLNNSLPGRGSGRIN